MHLNEHQKSRQKKLHKSHHKRIMARMKRKYKRLALALTGAAILTSSVLPGTAAIAHAAVTPPDDQAPPPATQQVNNPGDSQAKPAESGAPADYQKAVNVTATAYAPGAADNDQWGDKTRLGTQVRPGVIAVDPKVIPLGSRVYIQYPDGHGEYAVAEDTGGAIKGNRIDVAKWTRGQAKDFGIKQDVKVYVISSPERDVAKDRDRA